MACAVARHRTEGNRISLSVLYHKISTYINKYKFIYITSNAVEHPRIKGTDFIKAAINLTVYFFYYGFLILMRNRKPSVLKTFG